MYGLSSATATIIPIILTSDKTLLSGNAKHKAWPLYMTIGNISNEVPFVPGKNAAKLIACLPIIAGTICFAVLSNDSGIVTNAKTDEFRDWFRTTIHRIIRHALQPIERFMRGGTIMLCADGKNDCVSPFSANTSATWRSSGF